MSDEIMVHKVTLSSDKVVLLKEFKIKHQRLAAQAAAGKVGDNTAALGIQMAEEILKLLVIRINDRPVEKSALEDLDNIFSYSEYQELLKVIGQLMGESKDPQVEIVSFGTQ